MTTRRGTSNTNKRGSAAQRRARKRWLIEEYRANVDGVVLDRHEDGRVRVAEVPRGEGEPAARCYRCGAVLIFETLTIDRRKPDCEGGTYWDKANLRPACGPCNSTTGGVLGAARRAAS